MSRGRSPPPLTFDVAAQAMVLFAVLLSTFFVTYYPVDPTVAFRALFMLTLGLGGVGLGVAMGVLRVDQGGVPWLKVTALSLLGFVLVTVTQVFALSVVPLFTGAITEDQIPSVLQSAIAAIMEEAMYRGPVQAWLIGRFRSPFLGVAGAAILFAWTHMAAYQLLTPGHLGIFVALALNGVVFGLLAWYSGRISVAMAAHLLLNLVAAGLFGGMVL